MESIIAFEKVCKSYDEKTILENFSLNINKGEFVSIVGTSGSGKTTILRMINGMIKPDSGRITVMGEDLENTNIIELRRKIGYAIQGNGLFPHMTASENIAYVPTISGAEKARTDIIVDEMLDLVSLPKDIKNMMPRELSGGQQQRVGIARAYANSPEILLMDEPFGAVDAITRFELQKELKEIYKKTGCTIVFITHDMGEALKLGTKVLVLDKGQIQQFQKPEEVAMRPANEFVRRMVEMAKN